MGNIVEVKKLNKFFGKKQVLKDVSFDIREGEILGFIGPNGAGKTTTIKLILGLQSISSGKVLINGYDIKKDFEKAILKVGAIVESPDTYMYLTGRENLKLVANMYKGITKNDIDNIIKLVGLENRIDDKVSKYSLGMRQRLGIAASLLHNPNVLILDEPTNGLDPEGIKELRELIIKLANENKMGVLISSHNLAELESFCTNICIIKNGQIVETSSVKEAKKSKVTTYIIELNTTDGLDKLDIKNMEVVDNDTIKVDIDKKELNELLSKLIENNYEIYEVRLETLTLEDAFLEVTGGNVID